MCPSEFPSWHEKARSGTEIGRVGCENLCRTPNGLWTLPDVMTGHPGRLKPVPRVGAWNSQRPVTRINANGRRRCGPADDAKRRRRRRRDAGRISASGLLHPAMDHDRRVTRHADLADGRARQQDGRPDHERETVQHHSPSHGLHSLAPCPLVHFSSRLHAQTASRSTGQRDRRTNRTVAAGRRTAPVAPPAPILLHPRGWQR